MSNSDEKSTLGNKGIPPANPYGSGGGLNSSRDGWVGGKDGGEGGRPGTLSSFKRRRLCLQDTRRQEWEVRHRAEAERLKAEAAAQEQADARAKAIAHAEAQAHAQVEAQARQMAHAAEQAREAAEEANARADRERAVADHREALELLPQVQATQKQELSGQRTHTSELSTKDDGVHVTCGQHRLLSDHYFLSKTSIPVS